MDERPPGWYVDDDGDLRWWYGSGWTGHAHTASEDEENATVATPRSDAVAASSGASAPAVAVADPEAPARTSPDARRRRWIFWGALIAGGLVVGVVLANVIPAVVGFFAGSEEERAATAAVRGYDEAWADADCAQLEASTTPALRDIIGYPDCALFEEDAALFRETVRDYEQTVTGVTRRSDGSFEVRTDESYLNLVGADGELLADPEPTLYRYGYVVVQVDDRWLVDDTYSIDLPAE